MKDTPFLIAGVVLVFAGLIGGFVWRSQVVRTRADQTAQTAAGRPAAGAEAAPAAPATTAAAGSTHPQVRMSPPAFEFPRPIQEYTTPRATLVLRNNSPQPIMLTRVHASCGCMSVGTAGQKFLVLPRELPAKTDLPLLTDIATSGRYGRHKYTLLVEFQSGGKPGSVISEIQLEVQPGLRALPSPVVFHGTREGEPREQVVNLYDGFSGTGSGVKSVTTSDPARLQAELLPATADSPPAEAPAPRPAADRPGSPPPSRSDFRSRGRLRIVCTPLGDQAFEGFVTVVPALQGQPTITIPVLCWAALPDYRVTPAGVTALAPAGVTTVRRRLECLVRKGVESRLMVLKAPPFANVSISDAAAGKKLIDVVCTIPEQQAGKLTGEIALGIKPGQPPVLTIPITLYQSPKQEPAGE